MGLPPRWQWKLDRWKERLAAMFRDEPQETRPRLCPSCGTLVGVSATKCHECGTSMTYSVAAVSKALGGFLPEGAAVTYVVMFINGLLFLYCLMVTVRTGGQVSLMSGVSFEALSQLGVKWTPAIRQGEVWRLVMPIFLHGGLLHFGMNTLVLMDLGPQLEQFYGSARFFFLYIVIGIFSFIVSAWWAPFIPAVGASGSLMGMIGLMITVTQRHGGLMAEMYRKQLVKWVIYTFIFGWIIPFIDNAAHLGGLVAGYVLGRYFEPRLPMNAAERQRAYLLGWTAALIVLASFAAMLLKFFRTTQG